MSDVTEDVGTPISEFTDMEYLQRVVIHLYDLLDDIDTADDMAKSNDVLYRQLVGKLQQQKTDSGISSPDGYCLKILPCEFHTKDEEAQKQYQEWIEEGY